MDFLDIIRKRTLKIAHRGFSAIFDDNTMVAFKGAIKHDFDIIEMDIIVCSCGTIVIHHDIYVGPRLINEITYDTMCEIKKGEKNVLTLAQFFDEIDIAASNIELYLDLKGGPGIVSALTTLLSVRPHIPCDKIMVGAFNRNHLHKIKEIIPELRVGFITDSMFSDDELRMLVKDMHFLSVHWTQLSHHLVRVCKQLDVKLFVYTCKSFDQERFICRYNVDGIVSNRVLFSVR